jgi:hypothetical protein
MFVSYDSAEEMFSAMQQAEEEAISRISPRGRRHLAVAATNPTCWFRIWPDGDRGLMIVGKSQSIDEQVAKEIELGGLEDRTEDEIRRDMTERHERGYLFGRCWSKIEPDGELGSTHVSEVYWIDPSLFAELEECGWCLNNLLETDIKKGAALAMKLNDIALAELNDDDRMDP